jgi:DNA-binding transcriptional LysR family regulator
MNTTLDQWEVLEAVIQAGSFAAAAAKMNRSQSTISYAVSRLQEQFKIPLLELKGRKAQLTDLSRELRRWAPAAKQRYAFRSTAFSRIAGCSRLLRT